MHKKRFRSSFRPQNTEMLEEYAQSVIRTNVFDSVVENEVLDFLTNSEMSESLCNSIFGKIIEKILLHVRENMNFIIFISYLCFC